MLILTLAAAFKQRRMQYGGNDTYINYIFKEYNPLLDVVSIEPPANSYPAYIFQHAQQKMSDLQISGSFGSSNQTGLVWNTRSLRMFDVMIELATVKDARFVLVGKAFKVLLYSCFIDVGNAVIYVDTASLTSITKSSLLGSYISCARVPHQKLLRADAMFTSQRMLLPEPAEYIEGCAECTKAASGKACTKCFPGMFASQELCAEDPKQCGCMCQYTNQQFSEFFGECTGEPIQFTEPILSTDGKTAYFTPCTSHKSLSIDYSSGSATKYRFQLFKDDSCGPSNLQVDMWLNFTTGPGTLQGAAGLAFVQTQNATMLDLRIGIYNNDNKMEYASLLFVNPQEKKSLSLEHIQVVGNCTDKGTNRNQSESYHINGIYHMAKHANITIFNFSMQGIRLATTYDGTFCSYGVGVAEDCIFRIKMMYMGDNETEVRNPTTTIDFEHLEPPQVECDEKMQANMQNLVSIYYSMPAQLAYYKSMMTTCFASQKTSAFAGRMDESQFIINQSLITHYNADANANAFGYGVVAFEFVNSRAKIENCLFHGLDRAPGHSGVFGVVSGARSTIDMHAAVNLTTTNNQSGTIGVLEFGIINLQVYLNITFTGQSTGGFVGLMNGGMLKIGAAFGKVELGKINSNREIGEWMAGQVDDQICTEPPCILLFPEQSYVNQKDDENGECRPKIESKEPVGTPLDFYFMPCQSDVRVKVSYVGTLAAVNLSAMQSGADCVLLNVFVYGTMLLSPAGKINASGVVKWNYNNISNLTTEVTIVEDKNGLHWVSLVSLNGAPVDDKKFAENIIIRGMITQNNGTTMITRVAGLFCDHTMEFEITNISILGTQISVGYAQRMGLIDAMNSDILTVQNLLIDCYRQTNKFPNFAQPPPTTTFPCPDALSPSHALAARFKDFLKASKRPSFIKDVIGKTTSSGALVGYMYREAIFTNVSANISAYIQCLGTYNNGALVGQLFYKKLFISNTYVTGSTKTEYGGIIGYVQTNYSINMTIEYSMDMPYCALIMKPITNSRYTTQNDLLINLRLNGNKSAGIFYSNGQYVVDSTIIGIIYKNADDVYNYDYTRRQDEGDSQNVVYISNTDECPELP